MLLEIEGFDNSAWHHWDSRIICRCLSLGRKGGIRLGIVGIPVSFAAVFVWNGRVVHGLISLPQRHGIPATFAIAFGWNGRVVHGLASLGFPCHLQLSSRTEGWGTLSLSVPHTSVPWEYNSHRAIATIGKTITYCFAP